MEFMSIVAVATLAVAVADLLVSVINRRSG